MTLAPPELGIDLMSGEFFATEPMSAYAWMREHAPLYYDAANDLWAAAAYADVKAMGSNPQIFSNAQGHRPKFFPMPMLVDMDPPEHHRHRKLVSAGFTPRRMAALTDSVRAVCDAVLDEVSERGECDFVTDIAAPLPLHMIGDLLGVDRDHRDELLQWSEAMLRSQGDPDPAALEEATEAFVAYSTYMEAVLEDRLRTGNDTDLIGILAHADIDGDRLDHDALIYQSLLILIGGDETTRHVLSGGMLELQRHPDQLARLQQDPAALPVAVEEMLRWVSPIKNMTRTTTRDVQMNGTDLPAGAQILLLYPSANRDETVFDRADEFDAARDPNPHVAFGFGAHFCLGNQLARIELRVMFERLFARMPDLHLTGEGPFPRRPSNFITGITTLPVAFTPSARLVGQ